MKKTIVILVSLFFLINFLYIGCKKAEVGEDELSQEQVDQFVRASVQSVALAIVQALSSIETNKAQLNTSGSYSTQDIVTKEINWTGTGRYAGIKITGTATINTDNGDFTANGAVTITEWQVPGDVTEMDILIKSASLDADGEGNLESVTLSCTLKGKSKAVIDGTEYDVEYDLAVTVAGQKINIAGAVYINGKKYIINVDI